MSTPIGFGHTGHRKWQFVLNGREGTIYETVTPHGYYLYDWKHEVEGLSTSMCVAQSDHHLSKEEVEVKARAKEHKV